MKFDGYKVVFGVVGMVKIIRNFKNGLLNRVINIDIINRNICY